MCLEELNCHRWPRWDDFEIGEVCDVARRSVALVGSWQDDPAESHCHTDAGRPRSVLEIGGASGLLLSLGLLHGLFPQCEAVSE